MNNVFIGVRDLPDSVWGIKISAETLAQNVLNKQKTADTVHLE